MTDWKTLDPKNENLVVIGPMLEKGWLMPDFLKSMPQIAVDGGVWHSPAPVLWAGDGDSGFIPDAVPSFFKDDQNITDLSFCLGGVSCWTWAHLHAVGFSGGRRDHDLANLGEVHALMKERPHFERATFYDHTSRPVIRMFNAGKHAVDVSGIFGLLCIEAATVSLSGDCEYKVAALKLAPLSGRGVSNQGRGVVEVVSDGPFIVTQG